MPVICQSVGEAGTHRQPNKCDEKAVSGTVLAGIKYIEDKRVTPWYLPEVGIVQVEGEPRNRG